MLTVLEMKENKKNVPNMKWEGALFRGLKSKVTSSISKAPGAVLRDNTVWCVCTELTQYTNVHTFAQPFSNKTYKQMHSEKRDCWEWWKGSTLRDLLSEMDCLLKRRKQSWTIDGRQIHDEGFNKSRKGWLLTIAMINGWRPNWISLA